MTARAINIKVLDGSTVSIRRRWRWKVFTHRREGRLVRREITSFFFPDKEDARVAKLIEAYHRSDGRLDVVAFEQASDDLITETIASYRHEKSWLTRFREWRGRNGI